MSNFTKGQGAKVGIKFTEDLTGDVTGNAGAFSITGQQRLHIGGELVNGDYQIDSVERYPTPVYYRAGFGEATLAGTYVIGNKLVLEGGAIMPELDGLLIDIQGEDVVKDGSNLISEAINQAESGITSSAAGSARPLWEDSVLNGLPVLTFDGVGNQLTFTALGGMNQGYSFWVVRYAASNDRRLWTQTSGYSGNGMMCFDNNGFGVWPGSGGYVYPIPTGQLSANTWYIIATKHSTTQITGYRNGLEKSTVNCATNYQGMWIGGQMWNQYGARFQGNIARVIMGNQPLTAEKFTATLQYLSAKYGIELEAA
jgi:hypothetical protein